MTGTPFIAKQYIDAGWAVVPLVKGEKRAASAWQKKRYTPNDFTEEDGIAGKCGEPSGWRVDVDCDCVEAVAAARLLLPTTELIHGRPSKLDSHYWYECKGAKTTQFSNIKGAKPAMVIEIRSTGGYTALPPSEHPSGDVFLWSVERHPLIISPEDLTFAVRNVAIAALVVQHWSALSHASMGHLAGFLLHAKLPPFIVLEIFKTIGTIAPGNYTPEIVAFANATIGKFERGEKVSGGPKLIEALGEAVVNKLRSWLSVADLDAIEVMNEKHFWVRMGKDDVIGREDDADGVVFQRVRSLYSEYANQHVVVGVDKKGEPSFKPLFPAWLESKQRRQYKKVVFSPPPCIASPHDYNLWKGYAIEPKDGDCSRFMEHVHDVICSSNMEHFEYLMNLLAQTVQAPGIPTGVATVLRGKPGTGKGVFVRAIGDIFGRRHFAHVDKVKQLAGTFNAAMSGKIVVFADEAFFAGDKREHGALKRLITEPTLAIEPKNIDVYFEDNHTHLFMATNERWSYPAMERERRAFMLEVSDAHIQDTPYFDAVCAELVAGGLQAFLALLLERTVDMTLLRHVPLTSELRNQQRISMSPEKVWWYECLDVGHISTLGWPDLTWVPSASLHMAYMNWCGIQRTKRTLTLIEFGREMGQLFSAEKSKNVRKGKDQARCYYLRTLSDARVVFDGELGSKGQWDEEELPIEKEF